ncbi:MAG TPA: hypothetical protein VIT68_01535 [Candidatus Gracilibacteria bacterium]
MKRNAKKIQQGSIYFLSTFLVIASNYAFHLISARYLDTINYGVLSGLFAFFGIVAFASISLQTKATEATARLMSRGQYEKCQKLQKDWLKKTFLYSGLWVLLCFGAISFMVQFFHATYLTMLLFLPVYLITLPHSMVRGFMQGYQSFTHLSGGFVLESLLKCLLAFLALQAGFDLNGVIICLTVSQIPSFIWAIWVVFAPSTETIRLANVPKATELKKNKTFELKSSFWVMLCYFILYSSWFNLDMMLVQNLQPKVSGAYSVASKLGQIILFAGSNVANFLFPTLIEKIEQRESTTRINVIAFGLIIFGSLFGIFLLYLGKSFFVTTLFGEGYAQAEDWLLFFGAYGLIVGLIHYLVQWELALAKKNFIWILCVCSIGMFLHFYLILPSGLIPAFWVLIGWGTLMVLSLMIKIYADTKNK